MEKEMGTAKKGQVTGWIIGLVILLSGIGQIGHGRIGGIVTFIISLLVCVFFIPPLRQIIEKRIGKFITRSQKIFAAIAYVVLFGILSGGAIPTSTNNQESNSNAVPVTEETKPTQPTTLNKEDKEKLEIFYSQITSITKTADQAYDKWYESLDSTSVTAAYLQIDNIISENNLARESLRKLQVPETSIAKQDAKTLEEAKSTIVTAYYSKNVGLENMKTYLEKSDLKALSDAKNKFQLVQSFMFEAMTKLASVMNKYELQIK